MRSEDFDMFRDLLMQRSGLVLSPEKVYLLESRLMPVARKYNLRGLDELAEKVRPKTDERLLVDITEAMTTNESSFFRDQRPFDLFRNSVLPTLAGARGSQRKLRIWSAACSSGQEAYSLAMILAEEKAKYAGWDISILGTDISNEILGKAKEAIYTQFEVQRGLPIANLVKYFDQQGEKWQVKDELRRMVKFQNFNLLENPQSLGQFDVIFCRNVLIYFDPPTKTKVLEALSGLLAADGLLFLGGAETVLGITDRFKPMEGQRGTYRLANATDGAGLRGAA
ncbi:MAG: protein-glutamate O-methyltransferase [Pseudomonadota bacterium]